MKLHSWAQARQAAPPFPLMIPGTEGKGQLACIIIFEPPFISHPSHSLVLGGNVEQGFSNMGGMHPIHLGLVKTQLAGSPPWAGDLVGLGRV